MLQDSGAEANIMSICFTLKHGITKVTIGKSLKVQNVDGTPNANGHITHVHKTSQKLHLHSSDNIGSYHEDITEFLIADIGNHDLILRTP